MHHTVWGKTTRHWTNWFWGSRNRWINYLVSPVGSFGFLFAFYVKYPMVSAQVGLFECIGEQKKTSNRLEFSMNLAYFMVTLPIFHHLVFDIHIQNPCQEPCIHTIGGKFSRWLGQFQHPHLHLWAVHQQPGRDFQSCAACSAFSVKHDETTHCQDSFKKIMMNPGLAWPIGVIQVAFSADFWRFLSLGSADDRLDASRWQNDQWSGHLSQFRAWKSRTWMELHCVYLKKRGTPKFHGHSMSITFFSISPFNGYRVTIELFSGIQWVQDKRNHVQDAFGATGSPIDDEYCGYLLHTSHHPSPPF